MAASTSEAPYALPPGFGAALGGWGAEPSPSEKGEEPVPASSPPSIASLQRHLEGSGPQPPKPPFPPQPPAYRTLGERLEDPRGSFGEARGPFDARVSPPLQWPPAEGAGLAFAPPERPRTAPLRGESNQAGIALLISSMQELTAVVAKHAEELKRLREDCKGLARRDAVNEALSAVTLRTGAQCDRAGAALERIEARLSALEAQGGRGLDNAVAGIQAGVASMAPAPARYRPDANAQPFRAPNTFGDPRAFGQPHRYPPTTSGQYQPSSTQGQFRSF